MAAYRRVDDLVTCRLTASTPGSAPGPVTSMGELYLYFIIEQNLAETNAVVT